MWDWAAGALIAAEAGARVRLPPPSGGGGAGMVVAAAPGVADALARRAAPLGGSGSDACRRNGSAQQVAEWIFVSSAGSAGWVASGRRLASTASMSSLWRQRR